jgi:hypothetical protein
MPEDKDYFGKKLRRAERARENAYFRQLDQALIEQMRQKDRAEDMAAAPQPQEMFPSILVPVDFSTYAANSLRYAVGIADRFASSIISITRHSTRDDDARCVPAFGVSKPPVHVLGPPASTARSSVASG